MKIHKEVHDWTRFAGLSGISDEGVWCGDRVAQPRSVTDLGLGPREEDTDSRTPINPGIVSAAGAPATGRRVGRIRPHRTEPRPLELFPAPQRWDVGQRSQCTSHEVGLLDIDAACTASTIGVSPATRFH